MSSVFGYLVGFKKKEGKHLFCELAMDMARNYGLKLEEN